MKEQADTPAAKTFEDYFANISEKNHLALEELREIIREAAPMATEKLSYGIPLFHHHFMLVGFGAAKNHLAFYVLSKSVMKMFAAELKMYSKATVTIHFSAEKPLPIELIQQIVAARIAENEAKMAAKAIKKAKKQPISPDN
jgi:uncharacterized protein YdhG (YjbR/CyaY superfamily)